MYEYQVIPFGVTNVPALFMDYMNMTLQTFLDYFAVAFVDDILIHSKTNEEHVAHFRTCGTTYLPAYVPAYLST